MSSDSEDDAIGSGGTALSLRPVRLSDGRLAVLIAGTSQLLFAPDLRALGLLELANMIDPRGAAQSAAESSEEMAEEFKQFLHDDPDDDSKRTGDYDDDDDDDDEESSDDDDDDDNDDDDNDEGGDSNIMSTTDHNNNEDESKTTTTSSSSSSSSSKKRHSDDGNDNNNSNNQSNKRQRPAVSKKQHDIAQSLRDYEFSQVVGAVHGLGGRRRSIRRNNFSLLAYRSRTNRASRATRVGLANKYLPRSVAHDRQLEGRVFCGKFSQSGAVFCCASQDGVISLFDTNTWAQPSSTPFKQIEARDVGWSIVDIDYSPDERFVVYSSWSDCVHLCNVHGEYELHEALDFEPRSRTCMFGIRFSPNNRELLAGCSRGIVIQYDVEYKRRLSMFRGHSDDINSVSFLDDTGDLFVTGSDDSTCKIWDARQPNNHQAQQQQPPSDDADSDSDVLRPIRSRTPVGGFVGHAHGLSCVASRGDGRYVLTNGKDQTMKLWDVRRMNTPTQLNEYARYRQRYRPGGFDYRWHRVRRREQPKSRLKAEHSLHTFTGHSVTQTLIRCNFAPAQSAASRYVYSGSSCGSVFIWDAITGRQVHSIAHHESIVRDVSWHPHEPVVASASWDGTVGVHTTSKRDAHLQSREQRRRRQLRHFD